MDARRRAEIYCTSANSNVDKIIAQTEYATNWDLEDKKFQAATKSIERKIEKITMKSGHVLEKLRENESLTHDDVEMAQSAFSKSQTELGKIEKAVGAAMQRKRARDEETRKKEAKARKKAKLEEARNKPGGSNA